MTYSRTRRWLSLALLTIMIAGNITSAAPRAVASEPPLPTAHACYSGAIPPANPLCLVVPVEYSDGRPAVGATVTATFEGRSLEGVTQQLVDTPAGSAF